MRDVQTQPLCFLTADEMAAIGLEALGYASWHALWEGYTIAGAVRNPYARAASTFDALLTRRPVRRPVQCCQLVYIAVNLFTLLSTCQTMSDYQRSGALPHLFFVAALSPGAHTHRQSPPWGVGATVLCSAHLCRFLAEVHRAGRAGRYLVPLLATPSHAQVQSA